MISPQEIKKKAEQKYLPYLSQIVQNIPFEPIIIRSDKRYTKADYATFAAEIELLNSLSKAKKGYGYTVQYELVRTKFLGNQDVPKAIYFETEKDFLRFLGKEAEVATYKLNISSIITAFPLLTDWVIKNPKKVLAYAEEWTSLLKVCRYFQQHKAPNCYIRELPIEVHTKFVENHKPILQELLNILLSDTLKADETLFERRFHLKDKEPQLRFRLLDTEIASTYFSGVDDLAIPLSHFNRLVLPIQKVWIVENKTTLYTTLALPFMPQAMAIFGSGYGVTALKEAQWLQRCQLFYWGDLDVQGFEILSQFRGYFPHTQSFLMNKETFKQFFEGGTGTPSTVQTALLLTPEEQALYEQIKKGNFRLEQEKIPHYWVLQNLQQL